MLNNFLKNKKYFKKASDTHIIILFFINVMIANLNNIITVSETGWEIFTIIFCNAWLTDVPF